MSLYKASPNDRFILGFAMVCYMNVLVCCQKALAKLATAPCHFSTPGIQKMGKLTSFGVDMFFLNLLESKKMKNYILVLVLTCFSQIPGVQKMGKID